MKMRLSDSIKKWAIAAAAAALLVWCAADIDWSTLNYFSWGTFRATIANLCKPDFAAFYTGSSEDIFHLMLLTVGIGFFGTTIGTVLAVPFTLLASRSLWKNPVVPRVGKFVLDVLRAFPELVYAIIFIKVVGPGAFAGVLAIGVHQIGMLGKLFTEEMERMDETRWKPATRSARTGCRRCSMPACRSSCRFTPRWCSTTSKSRCAALRRSALSARAASARR